MKKDLEKNKKIKDLIFKIIHSITYVLSSLFIVVCIAVGVQSCNNKKSPKTIKNAPNSLRLDSNRADLNDYDDYYVYYSLFLGGEQIVNYNFQKNLADYYQIPFNTAQSSDASSVYITADLENCYLYKDGTLNPTSLFFAVYSVFPSDNNQSSYRYRLNYCSFRTSDGDLLYTQKVNNYYVDYTYNFYNFSSNNAVRLVFTEQVGIDNYLFNSFFSKGDSTMTFSFNNQINYNAGVGGTIEQPFINRSGGDYQYSYDFWFISGGELFNQIKVYYFDANAVHFLLSDKTKYLYSGANSAVYYSMMYYVNTFSNKTVLVNSRDMSPFQNGSGVSYLVENSSTWKSQYYRNITILIPNDDIVINLSQFNNNSGSSSVIGQQNIGLGNVFTLLSNSFSAIFPLISIQIIPGLTIGLLLFLPLIVSIIVLVFKAVKK